MNDTTNAAPETNEATVNPVPAAPVILTKEEKLVRLDAQIAKLQQKRDDIANDVVHVKAVKEVALPEVGSDILFNYGRRTATTEPVQKLGRVIAVKPAGMNAEGSKKLPAQIKISIGEGFEQEFVVIYPAQMVTGLTAE